MKELVNENIDSIYATVFRQQDGGNRYKFRLWSDEKMGRRGKRKQLASGR